MGKRITAVTTPKPIPSKAYLRFESIIKRGLNLLSLQLPVEKLFSAKGKPHDLSDMARTSVVLAVSAMDAYFTGVFAERLVSFLKKKKTAPKALVDLLHKAGLDTAVALDLLRMEQPYRRVRKLMDSYLARHVTQRMEVIDELFFAYGFKDFCRVVQEKARRKTLLASIQTLVQRRHNIVHRGDLNSYGKTNKIKPAQIKRRVLKMVKFVSCADELLQKQVSRELAEENANGQIR